MLMQLGQFGQFVWLARLKCLGGHLDPFYLNACRELWLSGVYHEDVYVAFLAQVVVKYPRIVTGAGWKPMETEKTATPMRIG